MNCGKAFNDFIPKLPSNILKSKYERLDYEFRNLIKTLVNS